MVRLLFSTISRGSLFTGNILDRSIKVRSITNATMYEKA